MRFNQWYHTKLVVDRFPLPGEITKSNYKYIINVSDEYISYCHDAAMETGIKYFWFLMNECSIDIGLNSLYGALQILWKAEQEEASVLLHCHAGINRSPTVRDAYYFLRTKKHREDLVFDEESEKRLMEFKNPGKPTKRKNNIFVENIINGHFPSIEKMESFLSYCETQFKKEETHRGGGLDWSKIKAGIS